MNGKFQGFVGSIGRFMPTPLWRAMLQVAFQSSRSEFEKFAHDYSFAPNMKFGPVALARRGFRPSTVIDVGAFEGNWSKLAREVWPGSRLLMVEPNLAKEPLLRSVGRAFNATLHFELLGSEDGREVAFNVMEAGSSVLQERSSVPRTVEKRRLRRLDSLFAEVEEPALLKIDAQGYELEISKGRIEDHARLRMRFT